MNNLTKDELKSILDILEISKSGSKEELIKKIKKEFAKYKKYKRSSKDKYTKVRRIGGVSKEGICYVVKTIDDSEYVMKTFPEKKSYKNILKEANFQSIASSEGIAPLVYDVDPVHKYIIMDKLDKHLTDYLVDNCGKLSKKFQKRILEICNILDKLNIFYNDTNIENFMIHDDELYLIDYGMCIQIDNNCLTKYNSLTPNIDFLRKSIVNKLIEGNCPETSYNLLL
jgi:predicted Ser/Thr protein kinase